MHPSNDAPVDLRPWVVQPQSAPSDVHGQGWSNLADHLGRHLQKSLSSVLGYIEPAALAPRRCLGGLAIIFRVRNDRSAMAESFGLPGGLCFEIAIPL